MFSFFKKGVKDIRGRTIKEGDTVIVRNKKGLEEVCEVIMFKGDLTAKTSDEIFYFHLAKISKTFFNVELV